MARTADSVRGSFGTPSLAPPVMRVIHWPSRPGCDNILDFQPVRCQELCRGARVSVVWDEDALEAGTAEFAQQVIELVEQSLLPMVESLVGPCTDIDGDGRLTIAVSPRLTQGAPDESDLSAFVRAADYRNDGEPPWSNQADLIYLAPHVDQDRLAAILAHELTHVAQFSALRQRFGAEPWPLPDWLLEGHAHAVELKLTDCPDNLRERWIAFCERPEACPLVMSNAVASARWRHPGCRGATAAFCLWLTEAHGEDWWRRIDELAVDDDECWHREFGATFAELYRQWTIDLVIRGLPWADPTSPALRPRTHALPLNAQTVVSLTGTATAYCVLPASEAHSLRVRVNGDPATPIQVTLVKHKEPRTK